MFDRPIFILDTLQRKSLLPRWCTPLQTCRDDSSAGGTDTFAFKCANVDGLLLDNETHRRYKLHSCRDLWASLGIGILSLFAFLLEASILDDTIWR